MKRKLYLLRHSYAEPPGDGPDIDRVLTMEGIAASRNLGRKLSSNQFNPRQIICSPAARAYETTMNLVEELGISEQLISVVDKVYEASVRELLEVINDIESNAKSALLVGHNPSISYFAELLTSSGVGSMEPCGLVTISFDDISWAAISQASGIFESYQHPNH